MGGVGVGRSLPRWAQAASRPLRAPSRPAPTRPPPPPQEPRNPLNQEAGLLAVLDGAQPASSLA